MIKEKQKGPVPQKFKEGRVSCAQWDEVVGKVESSFKGAVSSETED